MTEQTAFDLLRHGDTGLQGFRGRLDDPLTALGWQQLRGATEGARAWHAVLSSPMRRCAEFADDIARRLRLPTCVDDRLAELSFGDWEGLDAERLMRSDASSLARFWEDPWSFTPPNGEPMRQFEQRVLEAWMDWSERLSGQRILVVTHAGVIRILLMVARRAPRKEILQFNVGHASMHRIGGHTGGVSPC